MEYGTVYGKNMDAEEGGHSETRIILKYGTEHGFNHEVLAVVNENKSLINAIRQRQKKMVYHVLR